VNFILKLIAIASGLKYLGILKVLRFLILMTFIIIILV